jgi:hypothetical protein
VTVVQLVAGPAATSAYSPARSVYAAAMSKIRLVSALSVLLLAGACARTDAGPPVAPVPAGCAPTGDLLTWSPARTTAGLIEATLYGADALVAGKAGTPLLDRPFTPSITGVAAPASWLAELGSSLARETKKPVRTTAPSAEGQRFGMASGPEPVPVVLYTGIDQVSADFEVRCDPVVRGTFHAWSKTLAGGVACEYQPDILLDTFGRLALELCPNRPTPPPSEPVDAEEFPADQSGS